MFLKRNKLYLILGIALVVGHIWLFLNLTSESKPAFLSFWGCLFKALTNIPCPACGSTRAILAIFKGNLIASLLINPLGFVIFILMCSLPFWILGDVFLKKQTFYLFYCAAEKKLREPIYFVPCVFLVLANWIWNMSKNL